MLKCRRRRKARRDRARRGFGLRRIASQIPERARIRARYGAHTVHRNSLGGIGASNFPFYFLIRCLTDRPAVWAEPRALSSPVHRALFISFRDLWAAHSLDWLTPLVGNERDLQANHNRREIDTIYREITKRNNSSAHTPVARTARFRFLCAAVCQKSIIRQRVVPSPLDDDACRANIEKARPCFDLDGSTVKYPRLYYVVPAASA